METEQTAAFNRINKLTTVKCFVVVSGTVPTWSLPSYGLRDKYTDWTAGIQTGILSAGPGDTRPAGFLHDEQVSLSVLQQRDAKEGPLQHGD